jgi:uncharacterized protein (TIRG00374 family)
MGYTSVRAMMRKSRFTWKLGISLVFFVLILQVVRGEDFLGRVRGIDPVFFACSLAVSGLMIGVSCLKWYLLVRQQGGTVPYRRLLRYYFIGYYFTSLLPSNVGGDVVRSYYLGREMSSQSSAAVTVFVERVTGLAFLLVLVVAAPLLVPGLYRAPAVLVPSIGAAVLLVTGMLLVRVRQPLKRVIDVLHSAGADPGSSVRQVVLRRLEGWITRLRDASLSFHRKLSEALRVLRDTPALLGPVVGLTVVFYALTWLNVYVSFRAFDVDLSFTYVVALVPTSMMVSMIPIAPMASLGLAEGAYVYYFWLVGVPSAASLAMGLLIRCKLLLIGGIGLLCHLWLGEDIKQDEGFTT